MHSRADQSSTLLMQHISMFLLCSNALLCCVRTYAIVADHAESKQDVVGVHKVTRYMQRQVKLSRFINQVLSEDIGMYENMKNY